MKVCRIFNNSILLTSSTRVDIHLSVKLISLPYYGHNCNSGPIYLWLWSLLHMCPGEAKSPRPQGSPTMLKELQPKRKELMTRHSSHPFMIHMSPVGKGSNRFSIYRINLNAFSEIEQGQMRKEIQLTNLTQIRDKVIMKIRVDPS